MKVFGKLSLGGFLTILVLAACSSTSGPPWRPILKTDARTYAAGQTMLATLINSDAAALTFSACPFDIEHRGAEQWTAVSRPDGHCDSSLHELPRGRAATREFVLDTAIEPGTYRLVMWVRSGMQGQVAALRSVPFVVRSSGT